MQELGAWLQHFFSVFQGFYWHLWQTHQVGGQLAEWLEAVE